MNINFSLELKFKPLLYPIAVYIGDNKTVVPQSLYQVLHRVQQAWNKLGHLLFYRILIQCYIGLGIAPHTQQIFFLSLLHYRSLVQSQYSEIIYKSK